MQASWDGATLSLDGATAPGALVRGFRERYDPWTGRAWLQVEGTRLRARIGPGYAELRRSLRAWFPDHPFTQAWGDGRLPAAPLGLPVRLVSAAAAVALTAGAAAVGGVLGPEAALALALAGAWALGRLRDQVVVRAEGLRVGPGWAPRVPWHEVESVHVRAGRRRAQVDVLTRRGAGSATVPAVLVPALRARVRRLGGLELDDAADPLDLTYALWRAPATGLPWGVLGATAVGVAVSPSPWRALGTGLAVMAATALLGAAVEARATDWPFGAVLWMTGVYGVVIGAVGLGLAGWLG